MTANSFQSYHLECIIYSNHEAPHTPSTKSAEGYYKPFYLNIQQDIIASKHLKDSKDNTMQIFINNSEMVKNNEK